MPSGILKTRLIQKHNTKPSPVKIFSGEEIDTYTKQRGKAVETEVKTKRKYKRRSSKFLFNLKINILDSILTFPEDQLMTIPNIVTEISKLMDIEIDSNLKSDVDKTFKILNLGGGLKKNGKDFKTTIWIRTENFTAVEKGIRDNLLSKAPIQQSPSEPTKEVTENDKEEISFEEQMDSMSLEDKLHYLDLTQDDIGILIMNMISSLRDKLKDKTSELHELKEEMVFQKQDYQSSIELQSTVNHLKQVNVALENENKRLTDQLSSTNTSRFKKSKMLNKIKSLENNIKGLKSNIIGLEQTNKNLNINLKKANEQISILQTKTKAKSKQKLRLADLKSEMDKLHQKRV